jgi:adenylosuccinate lyase
MGYLTLKAVDGEIGSSAMPHKINPIMYENAKGNLSLCNSNIECLTRHLPVSILQRDLTDSTLLRNVGVVFSHMVIAYDNIVKMNKRITINQNRLNEDLEDNWVVVSEGLQTILRYHSIDNAYEKLLALTRKNEKVTREDIKKFIDELDIKEEIKEKMRAVTPFTYIGECPYY